MPPLVWVTVAWLAGLIAARHWLVPMGVAPLSLFLLSLIPLAASLLWREDRTVKLGGACLAALLLAALRYQMALPDLDDPGLAAHYNDGGWITVEGVVRSYPDVRDTWTNLHLDAETLEIEGSSRPVRGTVLVRAPRYPEYRYGDRLRVSGLLQTPPEFQDFSYREYLARRGIYSLIYRPQIVKLESGQGSPFWAAIYAVKDSARDVIARLVPDPEASLLQGILLGIKSGIPAGLYDDYNTTGTSHIIVISGSNISIVAALFALIFGRLLGKRRAYWITLAGLALYVVLVGADAAVVRAGVMGALLVTALYLGRRATAYVSLFASALFLTLLTPHALWDAGFQLSFAATLSLILLTPPLERLFEAGFSRIVSPTQASLAVRSVKDVLIVTLAAQILTLPLIAYHFGRVSLVSPLANLLILPVQPPIMAAGGAAAIVGLVPFLEPVARVIAWLPWLCLAYTNAVVRWLAGWPYASLSISQAHAGWLALGCVAIAAALWTWRRKPREQKPLRIRLADRVPAATLVGLMLVMAILVWLAVLNLPDGRLHVSFFDVGQGDAVFITTPSGQQILVDGGPSPSALTSALGKEMPFWDRSIDLLVLTHPDADHITGLAEVLARYQVGGWVDNGSAGDSATYAECQTLLDRAGVARYTARAGDRFGLEQGITLEVMHPPPVPISGTQADDNNNSMVLRLAWNEASFLLTADVEAEAERVLLQSDQPLAAQVLKIAHHGSGGSSTQPFLAATGAAYAVISVGADNRFGHPQQAVLDRLEQLGNTTILRTDESGTIEFTTDGRRLWVQTGQ